MLRNALPERVDPRILARDNVVLEGTVALSRFERVAECLCSSEGEVAVRLEFHAVGSRAGIDHRVAIRGTLRTRVAMECQYCLEPVLIDLHAEVNVVAADSDDQVRELSEAGEAMLLAGDQVPLVALLEDDLILSLPMVPRHGNGECIDRLEYHREEDADPHPFAVLARLKEQMRGGDD